MKVFTNTNFATGKADDTIQANRIVGLSTVSGNVMQAVADTVPIGVSHNYSADAGCPATVIPLGGGFARVKSGMDFGVIDLGVAVGPDANGCAVSNPTYVVGILAGLSADVEGAIASASGDDVVVLLCGCGGLVPNPNGAARFEAKDGDGLAVEGVLITITIPDGDDLTGYTDEEGIVEFRLPAGEYDWAAEKEGYDLDKASGQVEVTESTTVLVEITATELTEGTVAFEVLKEGHGVQDVEIIVMLLGEIVDSDTTDSDGTVSFDLEAGDYTWEADIDTFVYDFTSDSNDVTVTAGKTTEVDIVATSSTKGSVKFIVETGDSAPVGGVEIAITETANPVETKLTDARGIAKFKLDAGQYDWAATLADYTLVDNSGTITIVSGSPGSDVEIVATLVSG